MDKHLNVFYAYNHGNRKDGDKIKQLEDNITRALIVTLENLDSEMQKEVFEFFTKKEAKSKEFNFDLQNTALNINKPEKYVVVIQNSNDADLTKRIHEVSKDKHSYKKLFDENKEMVLKSIKNKIKDDKYVDEFEFNNSHYKIPKNELNSIYRLLHGSRPDAWMVGDKEVVLFEVKIDDNKVSPYQVYRHIHDKNGLNSSVQNVVIKHVTWPEVCNKLDEMNLNQDTLNNFLIKQLIQYLTMTAQQLSFKYLIEIKENNLNTEAHRAQFSHFLGEFDKRLEETEELKDLKRKNRGKAGLWEPYGIEIGDGISNNPHYTVSFQEDSIGVYITTRTISQVNEAFIAKLKDYLEKDFLNNNADTLMATRYSLSLVEWSLVDWTRGVMRGEKQNKFNFSFRFSELLRDKRSSKKLDSLLNAVLDFSKLKLYNQLDLGFKIDFYNFEKIRNDEKADQAGVDKPQIRKENKELLEDPYKIIDLFLGFMKDTRHLFDELNKSMRKH